MNALSRTAALLLSLPALLLADGETDMSYCSTCDDCDDPPTYAGSSNPTARPTLESSLIKAEVGFNTIDAFTGNAWRRVRDLSVPNAVGGLMFERIHITRANNVTTGFGIFGMESGWLHNWQYNIRDYGTSGSGDPYPNQPIIRIGLPDGRDISFTRTGTSTNLWLPPARYPMKLSQSGDDFTLSFPSGLQVEIKRIVSGSNFYRADAIEDARLNRWTLTYGTKHITRLVRVTGPDGRYLDLTYSAQASLTQNYTTLWSGNAPTTDAWQEIVLPSPSAAARFLCLYTSNDNLTAGNAMPVAELEFYDQNLALITVGTSFGSDPTVTGNDTHDKAFDGNTSTKWHYSWLREGYLGRDCGSGVTRQVKKIRYKPGAGWTGVTGMTLSFRTMSNPNSNQTLLSSVVSPQAGTVSYSYQTATDPSGYWSWVALANVTMPDTTQATYEVVQTHDYTRPLLWKAHDVKEVGRAQEIEYGYAVNGALGRVRSEADATTGQIVAVVDPNPGDIPYCRDVPSTFDPTNKKAFFDFCGQTGTADPGRLTMARDYENLRTIAYPNGHPTYPKILLEYADGGAGHLSKITDRLGRVMTFAHNDNGALVAQISPGGKKITWDRDARQRPTLVKHWQETSPGSGAYTLLHTTTHTYASGKLAGITHSDSSTESWTYVTIGTMTLPEEHTLAGGCKEKWLYYTTGNHVGKLYQHIKAFGTAHAHTTTYTYVDSPAVHFGKIATIHRTLLGTTTYTYSINPDKKRTTLPDGSWQEEVYDTYGDVVERSNSVYTGPTQKWTFTYGSFREKLTETDPLGRLTEYQYISGGGGGCGSCLLANAKPTQIIWPDGSKTVRTYDNNWNLKTETRAATTGIAQTTSFDYDDLGRLITRQDYLGRATSYTYAPDGSRFSTTDPLGFTTETAHSESGAIRTETETLRDSGGTVKRLAVRTSEIGPRRRPLTYQLQESSGAPLLRNISYVYSTSATYLGEQTTETNNLTARVTVSENDCCENLRRITHPGGATTLYTYDLADRVLTYTDPTSRTWTLAYSPENTAAPEWQQITPPDNNVFTRWSRPLAVGGVASEVLPSGRATAYTYDAAGQRTHVTAAAGTGEAASTVTTYNSMGRTASVTDADGKYMLYGYDLLGRSTTVTDSLNRTTTTLYETVAAGGGYAFPRERIRTQLPDSNQMAHRVHDYLGRTQTDTNANNETITYTYHLNSSRVLNYVDANSRTYAFTYNAAGERLTRSFPAGAGHTYTWHGDGQLASETRPDGNVATITYDSRGFPSLVNWSNNTLTPDVTLAFDHAGRLTSAANGATFVTRSYDTSGRLSTENSQINWPGYRVESAPMIITYTYDVDSRPASVTGPAGHILLITHNSRE